MSTHIHLNLINEDELVSSSPVRSHIIAPIAIAILTLSSLSVWAFEASKYSQLKLLNEKHNEIKAQLQPAYNTVLELQARKKNLAAINAQLTAYQKSKLFFGKVLEQIPAYVLPNIQFTKLEIPAPPPPLLDQEHTENGPTNSMETVKIIITGRTTGTNPFEAVDHLLEALKSNDFTNLIYSAQIPEGSFRQDITRQSDNQEYLLFGLECQCLPRKFK